ncbi:MAG: hypothetical protein C0404_07845 [Verrucomicrobia bacterium]|nr:hypothetical protein [Verrucomicrobiota bacterium]
MAGCPVIGTDKLSMLKTHTILIQVMVLCFVGLASYLNTFNSPFLFDNFPTIVNSPSMGQGWHVLFCPRPVGDLTFRLNYIVGQLNVADFHLTNILIHIMAGLLLYGIVRRTSRLPRFAGQFKDSAGWLAVTTAAIWLVHPLGQCLDYAWQMADSAREVVWQGVFLCVLGLASLVRLARRNSFDYLGAWFFVCLGPTSSFIPTGDMAFEHRMYLPLAGVVGTAVFGWYQLGCRLWSRVGWNPSRFQGCHGSRTACM